MRPPRPIPVTMKVAELGADLLRIRCPRCDRCIHLTDRHLERRWPGDRLLVKVVAQHYCRRCSKPGKRVLAVGEIDPHPRSGAEGGDGPSKWRGGA